MRFLHFVVLVSSVGMTVVGVGMTSGQDYPNKPIRILAPEPGGGGDFVTRGFSQLLSESIGQPVIVDGRASNLLPVMLSKAPPDGYTLLLDGSPTWIRPLLKKTSYDPLKDFTALSMVARAPGVLVVNPTVPAKSVKELIALAKAKPGQLNYGSAGVGSPHHIAMELFRSMAAIDIKHIPYTGAGPMVIALIGGEVQIDYASPGGVTPHIKSGKLRALAVTSAQPSTLVPGLPTVAETLPGYEAGSVYGLFAPVNTPIGIINRINQEIVKIVNRPDVKEKYFNSGIEAVGSSPKEFAAWLKSEIARSGKVIKDADIHADGI